MPQIFGIETGISVPSFASSFLGGTLNLILLVVVVMGFIAVGVWFYIDRTTYNKKIIVFENISGQGFQPVFKDRARIIKIGDGGEEVLFLKKKKVHRTAYGKKMGKNTYWFAIGQDGYWYNILLGDLDAKMGMLDIEPIDRDMRYMHVAIRKNITERYRKVGFMEKYGIMLFGGFILFILLGGLWFLIDQIGELINQATGAVTAAKDVIEPLSTIASKLDSVCSGGSGISSAG